MVGRDFRKNPITDDEIVNTYWHAVADNTIVGSFLTEHQVQHIITLHNKWYQNEVYNTYVDNITVSITNEVIRDIIDSLDGEPEEQAFWRQHLVSDISQLPDVMPLLPF